MKTLTKTKKAILCAKSSDIDFNRIRQSYKYHSIKRSVELFTNSIIGMDKSGITRSLKNLCHES